MAKPCRVPAFANPPHLSFVGPKSHAPGPYARSVFGSWEQLDPIQHEGYRLVNRIRVRHPEPKPLKVAR